jgi:hypothetical protein
MPHKADNSFFEEKKPWSTRKDQILSNYLKPYLSKVAHIRRPILIIDAFAGPGKFGDGAPGSPLLICESVHEAITRNNSQTSVIFIEKDELHFSRLGENIKPYMFAQSRLGSFSTFVPELAKYSETHVVFLYLDPFSVTDLRWEELESIFRQIGQFHSVEVLMNFNTCIFARLALQVLKKPTPPHAIDHEVTAPERSIVVTEGFTALDRIVGGDWWRDIFHQTTDFGEQVQAITDGVHGILRTKFRFACYAPIKHQPEATLPKYFMMFGSSHPDGLVIMNDCMIAANQLSVFETHLFAVHELENLILDCARTRLERRSLVADVVEHRFCEYRESDIKRAIGKLASEGLLETNSKTAKLNDKTLVWRPK